MKKILIISGHPDLDNSYANKFIIDELKTAIPEIEISFLDKLYPDFEIDVKTEQAKLVKADIIIWQFPFYWYSVPGLLKRWVDEVLEHGFAYGSKGNYLKGKKAILSFTVGSEEIEYAYDNEMEYPISDFLIPLRQTVRFCKMDYVNSIYSTGMLYIEDVSSSETLDLLEKKSKTHALRLIEEINNSIKEG